MIVDIQIIKFFFLSIYHLYFHTHYCYFILNFLTYFFNVKERELKKIY